MISNLVLDTLFARRPKINYVSPPICGLIQSPTSSGAPAVSIETISPLNTVHYWFDVECGLTWDPYPRAVCYNVYRSNLGETTFLGIVECGALQCMEVDPGCYAVTAITPDGETPFGQPICTETHIPPCQIPVTGLVLVDEGFAGFSLTWDPFPDATCYNVYKDGTKIESCIPFQTITGLMPSDAEQCFTVTAIAPCGETPQSDPVCIPANPGLNGLLAYWKMNELSGSRADATGNGWTAAEIGGVISNAPGLFGNAAYIDPPGPGFRTNKGLSVSSALDTRAVTTPFSTQMWVYPTDENIGFMYLFSQFPGAGTQGWYSYANNADAHFVSYNGGVQNFPESQTDPLVLLLNTWNHVVVTFDGARAKIYVNAVLYLTADQAALGIDRGLFNITIGNSTILNAGQPGRYCEGAYWDRALSAAEILFYYNGGAGRQLL